MNGDEDDDDDDGQRRDAKRINIPNERNKKIKQKRKEKNQFYIF